MGGEDRGEYRGVEWSRAGFGRVGKGTRGKDWRGRVNGEGRAKGRRGLS